MREDERITAVRLAARYAEAADPAALEGVLADVRSELRSPTPTPHFIRVLRQLEAFAVADLGRVEEAFVGLLRWFDSETREWQTCIALDAANLLRRVSSAPSSVASAAYRMFRTEGLLATARASLLRELLRHRGELLRHRGETFCFDDREGDVRSFVVELGVDPSSTLELSEVLHDFFVAQEVVVAAWLAGDVAAVQKIRSRWWRLVARHHPGRMPP
jgi:hypothetical protein